MSDSSDENERLLMEDWPIVQPDSPRKRRCFCAWILCGTCFGIFAYLLGFIVLALLIALTGLVYAACACPLCAALCWLKTWWCCPYYWFTDIYIKILYLSYQSILLNRQNPGTGEKDMPTEGIKPKGPLEKHPIDYALNIHVPKGKEEEFTGDAISVGGFSTIFEEKLALLPMSDRFEEFGDSEDPVKYVMNQLSSVYPLVYQEWDDKQSDRALVRFCLYGLAAHRIQTVILGGTKYFVVRTNALAGLPVRNGFARYGGDAYFTQDWEPYKIIDDGLIEPQSDGIPQPVTIRPQDDGWEEAKFRFRSSLSVLVTLVDHLYGIHLQVSNLFVTALRENVSADSPVRRFMTPFTFQTISVNDNARNNLVQPQTMANRCFAFNKQGMQMAFAAAPTLLLTGLQVSEQDGGPILNRAKYVEYLKSQGIDTEYFRQTAKLYNIMRKFCNDYLNCYYESHADLLKDVEVMNMMRQFFFQMESVSPNALRPEGNSQANPLIQSGELYDKLVDILANFMFLVTAGHEQVGAVEAYVQDVSFCAFKWTPDSIIGTKQTASAQGLLMSFTSTPMPKLLGSDWTHLFPPRVGGPLPGRRTTDEVFNTFQAELQAFSEECDAYDAAASSRPFPECFPMYVLNPKRLETSISV